ncbi:MAG: ATP-binding cassette domain-containing protein [Halobacteriales archaeon]|nr:ATP-binding cassette domain-containing protein [Halobacteriales archaeon]
MISAEGVEVSLGGEKLLKDVTASASNSFVGVVGPNGAGKTTLIRAVNGAVETDDGVVRVGGDDVSSLSARETARRVATMPQNTDVSFEFSVEEVVRMGRHPQVPRFGSDTTSKVRDAMERVDVARFADRSVHEVSGGERQRVLLARCLAQDADVLLLDEPTASLDIGRAVETLSLVRSLVDEGRTAVAVIHDLNLAGRFCDELVLVDDGRVVSSGAPSDVLTEKNVERVFGTSVHVGHDEATGAVRVTALEEKAGAETRAAEGLADGGDTARVHYVGDSVAALRRLERAYDVSVGVVPEGCSVAERFDGATEVVTASLGTGAGEEERGRVAALVEEADAVVYDGVGWLPEGAVGTTPTVTSEDTTNIIAAVESARDGRRDRDSDDN